MDVGRVEDFGDGAGAVVVERFEFVCFSMEAVWRTSFEFLGVLT